MTLPHGRGRWSIHLECSVEHENGAPLLFNCGSEQDKLQLHSPLLTTVELVWLCHREVQSIQNRTAAHCCRQDSMHLCMALACTANAEITYIEFDKPYGMQHLLKKFILRPNSSLAVSQKRSCRRSKHICKLQQTLLGRPQDKLIQQKNKTK